MNITIDAVNNNSLSTGVYANMGGTFTAVAPTRTERFKTEAAAQKWLNRQTVAVIIKPSKNNAIARRSKRRGEIIAARQAHEQSQRLIDATIDRALLKLSGCPSLRVLNAVSNSKDKPFNGSSSGSCCLPDVALYAAGYRKSGDVTAR